MRNLPIGRDEAELLIDLLDQVRGEDLRLDLLNDQIRELFGIAPHNEQQKDGTTT